MRIALKTKNAVEFYLEDVWHDTVCCSRISYTSYNNLWRFESNIKSAEGDFEDLTLDELNVFIDMLISFREGITNG